MMPTIKKQTPRKKRVVKKVKHDSAWPEDDDIKISIYGKAKTGKTTLWATFPKPILALICSGGKRPGELRSIDTPEYHKTIDPKLLSHSEDLPKLLESAGDYKTIVLDHASSLQDLVLKETIGLSDVPLALYRAAGRGESWSVVSRQQYGQVAIQMKEMLRAILDLTECNKVIIAQEREFNTEDSGELLAPYVGSAVTPSVVGWLNPAVDYICQTFIRGKTKERKSTIGKKSVTRQQRVKGVDYCLRTGPHDAYITGFRVPKGTVLPEVIIDPTFEKINQLIKQGG